MTHINPNPTKPDKQKEADNNLVFSYMTLRNLIGFSGMLLPFVLLFTTALNAGDKHIENSISDYYYTSNGDFLVVILSVLGVFLFTYNGYEWKEKLCTVLAAISGIGIAFSPTVSKYERVSFSVHTPVDTVPNIFGLEIHLLFAASFFILLSIISLKYFPRTNKKNINQAGGPKTQKEKRNIVYKVCGWIMLSCVFVLLIYFIVKPYYNPVGDFPLIFVLEAIAIEAFGISWITKGETLWPDGKHYIVREIGRFKKKLNLID